MMLQYKVLLATLLFHRDHQEQGLRRDKGHKSPLLTWSDLWGMFYGFRKDFGTDGHGNLIVGFVKKARQRGRPT